MFVMCATARSLIRKKKLSFDDKNYLAASRRRYRFSWTMNTWLSYFLKAIKGIFLTLLAFFMLIIILVWNDLFSWWFFYNTWSEVWSHLMMKCWWAMRSMLLLSTMQNWFTRIFMKPKSFVKGKRNRTKMHLCLLCAQQRDLW